MMKQNKIFISTKRGKYVVPSIGISKKRKIMYALNTTDAASITLLVTSTVPAYSFVRNREV